MVKEIKKYEQEPNDKEEFGIEQIQNLAKEYGMTFGEIQNIYIMKKMNNKERIKNKEISISESVRQGIELEKKIRKEWRKCCEIRVRTYRYWRCEERTKLTNLKDYENVREISSELFLVGKICDDCKNSRENIAEWLHNREEWFKPNHSWNSNLIT